MPQFQPFKGELQITHVTGPKDGTTEVITNGKIIVKDNVELPLGYLNERLFIQVPEHEPIYINNREIIGITELRNDDIIQIDEGSPLLRVRFTDSSNKTLNQLASDAGLLAKKNKGNTFFLFFYYLFKQIGKYAGPALRVILSLAAVALLLVGYNQYQFLKEKSDELDKTNKVLEKRSQDLNKDIGELSKTLNSATDFEDLIETYAGSVGFIDMETGYYTDDEWVTYGDLFDTCTNSSDYYDLQSYYDELRATDREYYADMTWSGSGFLVSEDGTILSNRHVLSIRENWISELAFYGCEYDENDFDAFTFYATAVILFPEDDTYYELANIAYHEEYDFATADIVDFELNEKAVCTLAKDNSSIRSGDTIITMGYPSGTEFLVYKKTSNDVKSQELYDRLDELEYGVDRTELYDFLIDEDLIHTHVTRGIVSQITDEAIAYDSTIYGGNSGGPIISGDGEIHGIITWLWSGNETLNVGVSSEVIVAESDNLIYDVL